MKASGRLARWTDRGLRAGAALGVLEGIERTWAVREFLRGPGDALAFGLLAFSFCALSGLALGAAAGAFATLAVAGGRLRLPAWLGRLVAGAAIGAAGAAWALFAFTLTVRFDAIVARGPVVIALGAAGGAALGFAWARLARFWQGLSGAALAAALTLLGLVLFGVQMWNAHFAPQSSLGIHVLADTALIAGAMVMASKLPHFRVRAFPVAVAGLILLLAWTSVTMRTWPALESLIKTRGSISAHTIRVWGLALDFDRDGYAPALLVGGEDPDNLDPGVPPPILGARTVPSTPAPPGPAPALVGARPHLVLLTLDACRADAVPPTTPARSRLGALQPATPRLHALFDRSARFIAGYTPSAGTEDTFAALFSGWDLPGILDGIPRGRRLDERLDAAGYAVRGFVNDPHFQVSSFDPARLARFAGTDGVAMVAAAAAFLDSLPAGRPGFVWVHVMDLHADLLKPFARETFSHRAHLEFYARALVRVDSIVGGFVAALDTAALMPRTFLVLTADHGEELGGHGHYHHNLSLYQPAIKVPLWFAGAGVVPGDLPARVSADALYPTLLEAAGLDPGRSAGRSLWPVLRGEQHPVSDSVIYSFLPARGFSARHARWHHPERGQASLIDAVHRRKVILRLGLECWEAYDVAADSMERWNLAGSAHTWPDSLRRELERLIRERSVPPPAPPELGALPREGGGRPEAAGTVAIRRHFADVRRGSRTGAGPTSPGAAGAWPPGEGSDNAAPRTASNLR